MSRRIAAALKNLRSSLEDMRRAVRPGARSPSESERRAIAETKRESIRRELAKRSAAATEHEELQQSAYWQLWRAVRSAGMGFVPPKTLLASVPEHVNLALSVVGDYDAAREMPGAFTDCLYRPLSDLPYPQAVIRRCCEFLIGIADSDPGFYNGDHELLSSERDALGLALFSLDYFLDLPAEQIPHRKLENLEYLKHQYLSRSASPVKPNQGDPVVGSDGRVTDHVEQVIGLGDNDEWMVLTASGTPMQVVRSAHLGRWNEAKVVAPAMASWLTLTPPMGVPPVK